MEDSVEDLATAGAVGAVTEGEIVVTVEAGDVVAIVDADVVVTGTKVSGFLSPSWGAW
jgi:hypothetical protein